MPSKKKKKNAALFFNVCINDFYIYIYIYIYDLIIKVSIVHMVFSKSLKNSHAISIKGLLDSIFNAQRNQFENSNSG